MLRYDHKYCRRNGFNNLQNAGEFRNRLDAGRVFCVVTKRTGTGWRLYWKRRLMPSWVPYGARSLFLLAGRCPVQASIYI